ncbi:MAG: ethanolamine utilization cobalamin adenosyltransferase [Tepidanaerobacteraceae bacterium]|nr:ethanolamine utilization cobalamin adenosyltransferase [Tepidanaerobacteraceae bacterium]
MKVLTEIDIRNELRKMGPVNKFVISPGTILTPAARSYLNENKIEIIVADDTKKEESANAKAKDEVGCKKGAEDGAGGNPGRYEVLVSNIKTNEKPEGFTHLYGNKLVPKIHPRVKLRGKIDSLEAFIIKAQVLAEKNKVKKLAEDLEEILKTVRQLMRAEVLSEPVEDLNILGFKEDEIRRISHNPKGSIGVEHFMPDYKMGELMAELNLIRTQIREVELYACEAFFDPNEGFIRADIIKALNRLSSAVYIMMCWLRAGRYNKSEG